MLQKIDDGSALEDLRRSIEQVVEAVTGGGKGAKGKVTLTLNIERVNSREIRITDETKIGLPKVIKDPSTFYVHPHGGLTRHNPDQFHLLDMEVDEDGVVVEEDARS